MLFIREYDTKSLDRSSVSMIDKYNGRLNRVGELLDELSSLIDSLLSLTRDIRNTLGQSKQRIYSNLGQVKEVINGNEITGTENTIKAIEGALETGDRAIDETEIQLENIEAAISCSEEYTNEVSGGEECGEACNQTLTPTTPDEPSSCSEPYSSDCDFCSYAARDSDGTNIDCLLCSHGDCVVDVASGEEYNSALGDYIENCGYTSYTDWECNESYQERADCSEQYCIFGGSAAADCSNNYGADCTFGCQHTSNCSEYAMPENCSYLCTDGEGCDFGGDDCSYATVCGQEDSCNESACAQYDCGEPCGETCHMTTDDDGDCSETSCGECSDDLSDDEYYGCDDSDTDMCGEDCGDSCGL